MEDLIQVTQRNLPSDIAWRYADLKPGFEVYYSPDLGFVVVDVKAQETCKHELRWDAEGENLRCTKCNVNAT